NQDAHPPEKAHRHDTSGRPGDRLCAGCNDGGGSAARRVRPAGPSRLLLLHRNSMDTAGDGHHQMADAAAKAEELGRDQTVTSILPRLASGVVMPDSIVRICATRW